MEGRFVEIRDAATCIPAFAFTMAGTDGPIARRAGFHDRLVILVALNDQRACYDPYAWTSPARTYRVAHQWLQDHWDEFAAATERTNRGVVDVEFILGERPTPKVSEVSDDYQPW